MKTSISYSLLAAAMACGLASAAETAYTTPVGYTTQALPANTLSLVGVNVLTPTLASGLLTGVSGAALTDTNVNFTTALVATIPPAVTPSAVTMAVLEITSGAAAGTVQEFVSWSGNTITLPSAVAGIAIGDSYKVRRVPSLQEIMPLGFLTASSTATNADKVWVPNGSGGYTKYYNRITLPPTGWRITTSGTNDVGAAPAEVPLVYIDGILVEKKGTAKDLVLSGEVKKTGSNTLLFTGLNPVSVIPPIGSTLYTAGLEGDIASSSTATNADKVWVPNGSGGYTKYYNRITLPPTGWRITTSGTNDVGAAADVPLTPGVYIERKGAAKVITWTVPASYSNL